MCTLGAVFLLVIFCRRKTLAIFCRRFIIAMGWRFLELKEKIIHFFILEWSSRDSIGPIVKIYGTIVAAKSKTILGDNVLPFAEDTMVPD